MMRQAAVLAFLFSVTIFLYGQKAEPNPQAPATPQANTGRTSASLPQATPGTTNGSAAPTISTQTSAADDAALQGRIQEALRNEPALAPSHISVNVTDTAIEISGTVPSIQEKQTAERIAESFDGNRKFEDKLLVAGQASAAPTTANQTQKTTTTNPR